MKDPLSTEKKVPCEKRVSDHTGFHWFSCGKPAKFRVAYGDGPGLPFCGVHANQAKRRLAVVVPL